MRNLGYNVLMNWYSKCFATVRLNGVYSKFFNLTYAVRQVLSKGGVLSSVLFGNDVENIIGN